MINAIELLMSLAQVGLSQRRFYHMAQGCFSLNFLNKKDLNIRQFVDGSSRELMMEASIIYGSIKCWILSITYIYIYIYIYVSLYVGGSKAFAGQYILYCPASRAI